MATIKAPNKDYNGTRAGVVFVDGVGETDDDQALIYFARHGYEIDTPPKLPADLTWEQTKDPHDMTVAELQQYAADNSIDLTGITRKADILAAVLLPGAPAAPVGTPGDGQVTVAYTAPTFTGASSIEGYEILVYVDGEQVGDPIADDASPLVVTDLENDTPYTFAVRAENAAGWGPLSEQSEPVTPTSA